MNAATEAGADRRPPRPFRTGRAAGFTLIELLIAMGILGVVLLLVMNWQMSTLNVSTRTNALTRSMNELNDLTGYVGDRVRSAVRVRVATSNLSINGKACTVNNPCLAVVLPEPRDDGEIRKYNLFVYRMDPRSETNADFVASDSWADTNVAVLQEHRSEDSGSSILNCVVFNPGTPAPVARTTFEASNSPACVSMRNLASQTNLTGFGKYLVSDYLTPASDLPATQQPFAYDPASRTMTLNFRYRQRVNGAVSSMPLDGPFTLSVQARNVP